MLFYRDGDMLRRYRRFELFERTMNIEDRRESHRERRKHERTWEHRDRRHDHQEHRRRVRRRRRHNRAEKRAGKHQPYPQPHLWFPPPPPMFTPPFELRAGRAPGVCLRSGRHQSPPVELPARRAPFHPKSPPVELQRCRVPGVDSRRVPSVNRGVNSRRMPSDNRQRSPVGRQCSPVSRQHSSVGRHRSPPVVFRGKSKSPIPESRRGRKRRAPTSTFVRRAIRVVDSPTGSVPKGSEMEESPKPAPMQSVVLHRTASTPCSAVEIRRTAPAPRSVVEIRDQPPQAAEEIRQHLMQDPDLDDLVKEVEGLAGPSRE